MRKTNWNELTIADQIKLREIGELQMATEDEKNMMVAALLADIPYDDFLLMSLDDVKAAVENTEFLLTQPIPGKARNKYVINGRKYRLFKDPSEMTVAQYIDFQNIHREGFDKYPAEMLSIFLVPEGHVYNDGYDKQQQLEDMLQMNIVDALGVCDFFIKRCWRLIRQMKVFCNLMLKVMKLRAPKDQKEMIEATRIQMKLILEELAELSGCLQLTR